MRTANTQTTSKIWIINDLIAPSQESHESLIHWDFPDEDEEPYGKLSLSCGEWDSRSDEQEWQDDYYQSIRL